MKKIRAKISNFPLDNTNTLCNNGISAQNTSLDFRAGFTRSNELHSKRKPSINLEFERALDPTGNQGDTDKFYAGALSPTQVHRELVEGACENENPESLLISKERWIQVSDLVRNNPKLAPYLEWLLDHFSGYSFEEIADRHRVTRQVAFHKVTETIEYLRKKIRGKQF